MGEKKTPSDFLSALQSLFGDSIVNLEEAIPEEDIARIVESWDLDFESWGFATSRPAKLLMVKAILPFLEMSEDPSVSEEDFRSTMKIHFLALVREILAPQP